MGLINIDKKGKKTKKTNIGFSLSDLGKEIVDIDNLPVYEQSRKMYFITDILSKNLFDYYKKENGFDFLNLIESFLNEYEFTTLDFNEIFILIDDDIDEQTKIELIFDYKRNTNTVARSKKFKENITEIFEKYNKPDKSKLEKRDFSNVKNQIHRIMEKLNLMIQFYYDPERSLLTMKNNNVIKKSKYRTNVDIREAKNNHLITSNILDGHHIIPHDFITTMFGKDRKLIENWKNIIFIDNEFHKRFPNKNNPYLILSQDINNIYFTSIYDNNDKIILEKSKFEGNIVFIKDMISHNKTILKYLKEVKML